MDVAETVAVTGMILPRVVMTCMAVAVVIMTCVVMVVMIVVVAVAATTGRGSHVRPLG